MRFSEAMVLGSMALRAVRGTEDDLKGGGCALGMAGFVGGNQRGSHLLWPWLETEFAKPLPCGCRQDRVMGGVGHMIHRMAVESTYSHTIVHLFNQHVCVTREEEAQGIERWTIDRLAEFIAGIEPREAEAVVENPQQEVTCEVK